MKKITCMLITFMMVITIPVALAKDFSDYSLEELLVLRDEIGQEINRIRMEKAKSVSPIPVFENEIRFRDLTWGMTHAEVEAKYPKVGNCYSITYSEPAFVWADGSSSYKFTNHDLTAKASNYAKLTVAGYEASSTFLFAYTVTSPIIYDDENTILIGAKYTISDLVDPDGVANDLIEKLKSVYGEYSTTSTSKTLGGYALYYYFWFGNNDTFLVFKEMNGGSADHNSVTISYGWRGSDEYLYAFDNAISAEKAAEEMTKFGNGNIDGL